MSGVSERAIRLFAYILYIKHNNLDREEVLEQIHLHKHKQKQDATDSDSGSVDRGRGFDFESKQAS